MRNFFGTLAVLDAAPGTPQKHHRLLQNGIVVHGLQVCDPARRALPTAYYGEAGGVVAVNISSRHLDLAPVVAAVAGDAGLRVEVIEHRPAPDEWWLRGSQWALLWAGSGAAPVPALPAGARYIALPLPRPAALWTDDHAALR